MSLIQLISVVVIAIGLFYLGSFFHKRGKPKHADTVCTTVGLILIVFVIVNVGLSLLNI